MAIAAAVADPPQIGRHIAGSQGGGNQHLRHLVAGGEGDGQPRLDQPPGRLGAAAGEWHLDQHPRRIDRPERQARRRGRLDIGAPGLQMQLPGSETERLMRQILQALETAGQAGALEQGGIGGHPTEQPARQPGLPGGGIGRVEQQLQGHRWKERRPRGAERTQERRPCCRLAWVEPTAEGNGPDQREDAPGSGGAGILAAPGRGGPTGTVVSEGARPSPPDRSRPAAAVEAAGLCTALRES